MVKNGIEKSKTDYLQPYRVWYNSKIIYFAQTREEAQTKLEAEKERHNRPKQIKPGNR